MSIPIPKKIVNYEEARLRILERMCEVAERAEEYFEWKILFGDRPYSFKPGLVDKTLFLKIIEENKKSIKRSLEKLGGERFSPHEAAIYLMSFFYSSGYENRNPD